MAHPWTCQAAGSCELLFCPSARRNSRASTQALLPVSLTWLTWFPVLSFSITFFGVLSRHLWEITLQWTADRWHTSFFHLVEIPKHISPSKVMCLWIFISFAINRRVKKYEQYMTSNHVSWTLTSIMFKALSTNIVMKWISSLLSLKKKVLLKTTTH